MQPCDSDDADIAMHYAALLRRDHATATSCSNRHPATCTNRPSHHAASGIAERRTRQSCGKTRDKMAQLDNRNAPNATLSGGEQGGRAESNSVERPTHSLT